MDLLLKHSKINGNIFAQPSKSDTHRKIICATCATGLSTIDNVVLSKDILATIEGARALGARIRLEENIQKRNTLYIDTTKRVIDDKRIINCNESGSTLRFFAIIAAAFGGETTFLGKGMLPKRPIDEILRIYKQDEIIFEKNEDSLPLKIDGFLKGGNYLIRSDVSSQFLSGLLMALPLSGVDSTIEIVGDFNSKGYVDMTVDNMKQFGVNVRFEKDTFYIPASQYTPNNLMVEGDWSNCAYFYVMNMLGADVSVQGLDIRTYQPDSGVLRLLYEIENEENTIIDVSGCPDLAPALAVAGCMAKGTTKLINAHRLRKKECDRLEAITKNLQSLRVKVEEKVDSILIYGNNDIKHGVINTFNDHRIAMAFASLITVVEDYILIKDAECVNKSYPTFFSDLYSIGGDISEYKIK